MALPISALLTDFPFIFSTSEQKIKAETDIKADIPVKEGRRLWALLNTARNLQGEFR
jgi:hypothetical protein